MKLLLQFSQRLLLSLLFSLLVTKHNLVNAEENVSDSESILTVGGVKYACKCYEGERCWPSAATWKALNATIGGNLLKVVPPGSSCYDSFEGKPTYNEAACAEATQQWGVESWQVNQTVNNLWQYWTNNTCLPTKDKGPECTLGWYPEYVIMAKEKKHIKAGVDFARKYNIRLVIRNTGHDFMGRSTGYGSLAINTHSFKDVSFTKKYTGPGSWRGGAVTVGAGIQVRELYRLAFQQKPPVVVVGGECPTVGLAGGYIQGGGHGPLATFHGMAADQALSFDVVTADGKYVTANAVQNQDLFWALKGGGPGTYGVVVSVTVKTFPEIPTAGVILNINQTHTTDLDLWWKGVAAFHNRANLYVDNGMFVYYELGLGGPGALHVQPFVGPNMTAAKINEVLKPLFDDLKSLGLSYSAEAKEYPTFFELYIDLFEDEMAGQNTYIGGRILTKKDIEQHGNDIIEAYKTVISPGDGWIGAIVGHIVGPGYGAPVVDNAVNPAWRDASSFSITLVISPNNATWEERLAAEDVLSNVQDKALRDASPYGAAYVNEGNLKEPNWQYAYWGANYKRLYSIRKKWDPNGVFYTRATPGTEDWEVINQNTKLCRKIS